MLAQNDRKLYIKIMVGNILFNFFINKGIFESDHEWSIGKHNNTAFEMHYCMKGKGIIVIDDVPYELNEGDFCLIRPGIYHAQQKVGDFELQKCCLSFDFKAINYDLPSDLNPLVLDEGQRVIKTLNEVDYFVAHDRGELGYLIDMMLTEIQGKQLGYYTNLQCLLSLLLMTLVRCAPGQANAAEKNSDILPGDVDNMAIDVFFFNHYTTNVQAEDLARELNVSVRHLNRILMRLYHKTFKQILIEIRMVHAMEYLKTTDLSLASICQKVGYGDVNYFSKLFKEKNGVTPAQYRAQALKERE